jgi:hypothetical protein
MPSRSSASAALSRALQPERQDFAHRPSAATKIVDPPTAILALASALCLDLKTLQLERIGVGGEIEINGANLSLRRLLAVRFRPQRK